MYRSRSDRRAFMATAAEVAAEYRAANPVATIAELRARCESASREEGADPERFARVMAMLSDAAKRVASEWISDDAKADAVRSAERAVSDAIAASADARLRAGASLAGVRIGKRPARVAGEE